jgi:serine O-acetyltransferase
MEESLFIENLFTRNSQQFSGFPDKHFAKRLINELFNFLFSSYEGRFSNTGELTDRYEEIQNDFKSLLEGYLKNKETALAHSKEFFKQLPHIYDALLLDAEAVLQFDPAANSVEEVFVAYPGFFAIATYRFAHQMHLQGIKILPRLMSEYGHSKTGIDIHPGAAIGHSFFIDHGTGIVIGETAIIGNNVKIYQGVTLGALTVMKATAGIKRHPTIADNVIIYSGATILGGDTLIGKNSVIGGNVWLTNSVPAHSIVYHKSEVKVRDNNPLPEGLNFII